MRNKLVGCVVSVVVISSLFTSAHAQNNKTSNIANRVREMDDDDLILFNVAVKGRVVELLANEIARTEIIRALLYEYAKECVQNITVLEKGCFNCMVERCENRFAECDINNIRLSEVISHNPSPIQGLQFLSKAPKRVSDELKAFADNAKADILRDVPNNLRQVGEEIVHSEIDESLTELKDNMDSEKTLQTITIHFQKATNNIHLLPELGEKLGTLIVENGDKAINIAELLASKLRHARPYIDSMKENGDEVKEKAPGIIEKLGEKVATFKERIAGVFGQALDTFSQALDNPNTPVIQELNLPGNQQQVFNNPNPGQQIPPHIMNRLRGPHRPRAHIIASHFQTDFGPFSHDQSSFQNPGGAGNFLRNLEQQLQNQLQNIIPNQPTGWNPNAGQMMDMNSIPQQTSQFQNNQFGAQNPNNLVLQNGQQNGPGGFNGQPQQMMPPPNFPLNQGMQNPNNPGLSNVQQSGQIGFNGQPQQTMPQNFPQNQGSLSQNMQVPPPNQPSPPTGGPQMVPQNFPERNSAGPSGQLNGGVQVVQAQQTQSQIGSQGLNQAQIGSQGQMQGQPGPQGQMQGQVGPQGQMQGQLGAQNQMQGQFGPQGQMQGQIGPQGQMQGQVGPQGQFTAGQSNTGSQMQQAQQIQFQQPQQRTNIGQGQGRRRRQTKPDCEKLRYDPETYCKTYESQCHNCTVEKRLRFEVCGEGVERARDEIKRLDNSVQNYLEAYEKYISSGPLALKVELNDKNRLVKTNSYFDAFVTAKVGASIFRYKTKMILNINDLRTSGSQIGDEIWEKLWEQKVFEEAERLDLTPHDQGDMGQLHKFDVHQDSTKAQAHKNSASDRFSSVTNFIVGFIFVIPLLLL